MATYVGVLAKKIDEDTIHFIYPKTTAEVVEYTEDQSIKDKIDELASSSGLAYGVCESLEDEASKTVATDDNYELSAGRAILVKFTNSNTAENPTLNINETGAKSIMRYGDSAVLPYSWNAGEILELTYDGTNYIITSGSIASTTYYGATKLEDSVESESTTTAATPSAVKTAYDAATNAQNSADEALQYAEDNKYTHPTVEANDTTSEVSPGSGDTFTAIDSVIRDDMGHVTGVNTKTVTLPEDNDTTYTSGSGITIDSNNAINHTNSITAGTASGSESGALAFGGNFDMPTITYDDQGHITGSGTTTMTMPSISDSVTSSESGIAASSAAVKEVYDYAYQNASNITEIKEQLSNYISVEYID